MDNMEQKINAFLSNPEAMEKLMSVARSIRPDDKPPKNTTPENQSVQVMAKSEPNPFAGGFGSLLDGLQNVNPQMLSSLMSLIGAYNGGDDRREALLMSIKPYLRNERQAKLERAAQMMRLARTARIGLKSLLGGVEDA